VLSVVTLASYAVAPGKRRQNHYAKRVEALRSGWCTIDTCLADRIESSMKGMDSVLMAMDFDVLSLMQEPHGGVLNHLPLSQPVPNIQIL